MRTAQRRLFNAIAPELSKYVFHEHISAVEKWVKMDDDFIVKEIPELSSPKPDPTPERRDTLKPSITPSPAATRHHVSCTLSNSPPQLDSPSELKSPPQLTKSSRASSLMSFLGVDISDPKSTLQLTPRALELVEELEIELGQCDDERKMPPDPAMGEGRKMPAEPTVDPVVEEGRKMPAGPAVDESVKEKYDLLACLGVDVLSRTNSDIDMGKWNSQNTLRQLVDYMEGVGEDVTYETKNSRYNHQLLKIATRKSDKSCPDIRQVLKKLFGMGNKNQLIGSILGYLLDHHKEDTLDVLREERLIPKIMNEYQIAATMDYAKVCQTHWKKIVHCLKTFQDTLGLEFASEGKLRKLGGAHVNIHADVYFYEKKAGEVRECVKYWYKDPAEEFVSSVESIINAQELDPKDIAYINHCAGGDHADVKFRFLAKTIVATVDGKYYVDIYSLADVHCKKDTGELLNNTIMDLMVNGMNEIAAGKLIFNEIVHEEGDMELKEYKVELVETVDEASSTGVIKNPRSYLTGDLAFLSIMLGKENFEGWWCNFCKGYRPNWQQKGCSFQPWSITKLIAQALKNEVEDLAGTDRMGVGSMPVLKEGTTVIFPGLHGLLGIGNQLLNYTFDVIDQYIEPIAPDELLLQSSVPQNESLIEEEKTNKEIWINSIDEGMVLDALKLEHKELTKTKATTVQEKAEKRLKKKDLGDRIKAMDAVLAGFETRVKEYEKQITDAKKGIKALQIKRKKLEDSLYHRVELVLAKYKIKRGAFHGGDLNGVNIIRFMNEAEDIMDEICAKLIEYKRDGTTEELIKKYGDEIKLALQLWNKAFSMINKRDPTDDWCNETQKQIDLAIEQMFRMGLAITPKGHGMLCHIVM